MSLIYKKATNTKLKKNNMKGNVKLFRVMIRPNRYKSPKIPIFMCTLLILEILNYYKLVSMGISAPISVIILATVNIVQQSNSDKSKTKKLLYIVLNALLIIAAIIVLIKFINWRMEHRRWQSMA